MKNHEERPATALGEYPLVTIPDVEPVFIRAMMLGAMAIRYQKAVPSLEIGEAYAAARATWDTEWPGDPAPRTFEAAEEAVRCDLEHWED